MLLVKCLQLSGQADGDGIYTLEAIRAGDTVWRYSVTAAQPLPRATSAALGAADRRVAALAGQARNPAQGQALELRHAERPNLDFSRPMVGIALRDIAEGEELTADHAQFFGDAREQAA